jgi:hypothetical protein
MAGEYDNADPFQFKALSCLAALFIHPEGVLSRI